MRPPLLLLVALVASCCPKSQAVFEAPVSLQPDGSLSELLWLTGTWLSNDEHTEEHWSLPRGGTMMGYALTVVGGRRQHYEHLRIEAMEGVIRYHAAPVGQAKTAFTLVDSTGGRLVFENLEHDFPKRIVYRSLDAGHLEVHIEGDEDGKPKEATWEMWRVEPPVCSPYDL